MSVFPYGNHHKHKKLEKIPSKKSKEKISSRHDVRIEPKIPYFSVFNRADNSRGFDCPCLGTFYKNYKRNLRRGIVFIYFII